MVRQLSDSNFLMVKRAACMLARTKKYIYDSSEPIVYRPDVPPPIFIAIDFEMREHATPNIITEAGITRLDPLRLDPSSNFCREWKDNVEAFHLRVREHLGYHAHFTNKGKKVSRFVYGESRIVDSVHLNREIIQTITGGTENRQYVLVLHGGTKDIKAMEEANLNLKEEIAVVDCLETQMLSLAQMRAPFEVSKAKKPKYYLPDSQSLEQALHTWFGSGWEPSTLHNAGNDAALTMHLMFAILLSPASVQPGDGEKDPVWDVGDGGTWDGRMRYK